MTRIATATDLDPPDKSDSNYIDAMRVQKVRRQLVDEGTAANVAETFKVLSDPTRVRLISALAAGELCVIDLARMLGITQSAASHQLRMLRHLDLVNYRRAGKLVYYSLDAHALTLLQQGLDHIGDR